MWRKVAVPGLLLLTAMPQAALAQKPENNWEALRALRVGQKIVVVDMDLKTYHGTFVAYTEEAISLRTDSGDRGIERAHVLRVSDREHSKRLRNTLLGAAIGAGAALAVGAIVDESFSDETNIAKTIFTPIGAGAGAAVGAAFAGYKTTYRAPARASP